MGELKNNNKLLFPQEKLENIKVCFKKRWEYFQNSVSQMTYVKKQQQHKQRKKNTARVKAALKPEYVFKLQHN